MVAAAAREAYYLVSQPRRPLEQRLAGVLVHDQAPSLRRDGPYGGGLGGRGPVQARRCRRLWRDAACSAVCLGRQRGRAERGGGAGLDRRAGIMIRGGGSFPRGAALLTRLRRERDMERERVCVRALATSQIPNTHTHKGVHVRAHTHTLRSRCRWMHTSM